MPGGGGVKAAEIWAVAFTGTCAPYGGFWADRRPQILYERSKFHDLTQGRFDGVASDISSARSGNYGASGAHQYERLEKAMGFDESAALKATSWGLGQVLGKNYELCGFGSPQEMVGRMVESEDQQLLVCVRYMLRTGCARSLAAHDWPNLAQACNGSKYPYGTKLQGVYANIVVEPLPDLRVHSAQLYLMYLGFEPGDIDGRWVSVLAPQ